MSLAERTFPVLYGLVTAPAERGWLGRRRAALLASASGTVVELGAGTGANLPHYQGVERVIATEPSPYMRARLRPGDAGVPVDVVDAPAEALPLADRTADTVVSVYVFCTVANLGAALAETIRVLRPGGRLLFLEHVRASGPVGRLQDAVDPVWSRAAAGCHLNRRSEQAIAAAGFSAIRIERFAPPVPGGGLMPMVVGVAVRP
jgi:SAM-dependent methyltransferase